MTEQWRTITSHTAYEVSNAGRVRRGENILKQQIERNGYYRIMLDDRKRHLVHRLVAREFCVERDRCHCVNHKDGDRSNNAAENLEWVTPSENQLHSFAELGRKHWAIGRTGAKNPLSRPVFSVDENGICNRFENARHAVSVGEATNPYHINSCCNGRRSRHAGKAWSYQKLGSKEP